MPFFSPLWARTPHVTWLHHVHAEMWQMTLPPRLAAFGNFVESRLAPPLYRRTPIVTLSESSKQELVHDLKFKSDRVTVVPPGIDPRYTPGGEKSPTPLVVAVGRLVPVKRFDLLIEALVAVKPRHPELEAVIAGEGYCREALEAQIREAGAADWISLPGRIDDEEKIDLYRRAWSLAMTSSREGWGMIIRGGCNAIPVATRSRLRRRGGRGETACSATVATTRGRARRRAPAIPARADVGANARARRRFTWEALRAAPRGVARARWRTRGRDRGQPGTTGTDPNRYQASATPSVSRAPLRNIGLRASAADPLCFTSRGSSWAPVVSLPRPGRLLERAPSMWDPNIGMGTVTHQNIGYVFPMGPFYWVTHQLGMPAWVAQRVWFGTIRFLLLECCTLRTPQAGVVVAAVVFMLSPCVLDFKSRSRSCFWRACWMLPIVIDRGPMAEVPGAIRIVVRSQRCEHDRSSRRHRFVLWLFAAVFVASRRRRRRAHRRLRSRLSGARIAWWMVAGAQSGTGSTSSGSPGRWRRR
jgi:hypothetical protein